MAPAQPAKFHIKPATTTSDLTAIKTLFTAYATSLGIDLTFQNFAQEISSLPGLYSPPTGALFLAMQENIPIGCVALRPLPLPITSSLTQTQEKENERCCEMKRLYCTPESRGMGVGKKLVEEVVQEAERLGYVEMRLDTLEGMVGARRLYEGLGFEVCERYYDTPLEGTIFLSRRLGVRGGWGD